MEFASDNTAGLSAEVSEALLTEGARFGPAYGGDQVTRDLDRLFSDLFETEVRAFPVSSGTAANGLALACVSVPHTQILCAQGEDFREGVAAFLEKRAPVYGPAR